MYMKDLAYLNAGIYTYWNTMPADPASGIFDALKHYVNNEDRNCIEALEKDCKYWKSSRVHGVFIVLFDRPDGTILVSKDLKQVYLVLGQAQSLGEVANFVYRNGAPTRGLPYDPPKFHGPLLGSRINTTLLNWEDKIVYDGLLFPEEWPGQTTIKKAVKAYLHAVDTNTLIVALHKREMDLPKIEVFSSGEYDRIRNELRHYLDEIKSYPSTDSMWVLRRHGYTEQENPNHLVTVLSQGQCLAPFFQTQGLVPTIKEYVDLIYSIVIPRRVKPQNLAIDADVSVEMLRSILKIADIYVGYYPPPSPEERKVSDDTNPYLRSGSSMCGVCGATNCADGTKLLVCSRCRSQFYCSKEHQKQHWKRHKKVCF